MESLEIRSPRSVQEKLDEINAAMGYPNPQADRYADPDLLPRFNGITYLPVAAHILKSKRPEIELGETVGVPTITRDEEGRVTSVTFTPREPPPSG